MSGYAAAFTSTEDRPTIVKQLTAGPAWRVKFSIESRHFSLPIPYARKRDAECGAAWIGKRIPLTPAMTLKDFREAFLQIAGTYQDGINLMVAETCQW